MGTLKFGVTFTFLTVEHVCWLLCVSMVKILFAFKSMLVSAFPTHIDQRGIEPKATLASS